MSPPQTLLWVNSLPKTISDELWTKWYLDDHLIDLVQCKAVSNAALFHEIPLDPTVKHERPFLAIYQSVHKEPMKSQEYADGPRGAEVFKQAGVSENPIDNGEFDVRNYELIQDYDPNGVGNGTAPYILTVEMSTTSPADFDSWYRNEHLHLLSKMPGFQRALRYQIGAETGMNATTPAMYLAMYFVDDPMKAIASDAVAKANGTELTMKFIAESQPPIVIRCWKLLGKEWADEGGAK